jgi:hypothetical protein
MAIAAPPREEFAVLPGQSGEGKPVFCVLVKRTYDLRSGRPPVGVEKPNPLTKVDAYYDDGDAESSTVKYETDFTAFKLATDVVVIAKAYAPGGRPVKQMDASVEVAGRKKTIRVIGDRRCVHRKDKPPKFTDPTPFAEIEIRYDRAYGGSDEKSSPPLFFVYPRNHRGTGVALKNIAEVVEGLPLPNLEDPNDLLTPERVILGEPERWNQQPLPQGLGWFQKTSYPRCSFAMVIPPFVDVDTVLREETLGLVPKGQIALSRQFKLPSFDLRFNSGASLGLLFPYLAGGEPVRLANLTPEGELKFNLPTETPRIMLDIGLGENELKPVLHTVCIRAEEKQLDLVWRGAHEHPGLDWLPEMKRMVAEVS